MWGSRWRIWRGLRGLLLAPCWARSPHKWGWSPTTTLWLLDLGHAAEGMRLGFSFPFMLPEVVNSMGGIQELCWASVFGAVWVHLCGHLLVAGSARAHENSCSNQTFKNLHCGSRCVFIFSFNLQLPFHIFIAGSLRDFCYELCD